MEARRTGAWRWQVDRARRLSRLLVFGLDGGDYALICDLIAQGRMPTVARLAREGTFGPLESTVPAVTPTAWSTFLTGLNPGGHGIFNFASNPNRDRQRVESANSRSGVPFWRHLGAAGRHYEFFDDNGTPVSCGDGSPLGKKFKMNKV